ncbi:unnamed protein product [Caretta caretta]
MTAEPQEGLDLSGSSLAPRLGPRGCLSDSQLRKKPRPRSPGIAGWQLLRSLELQLGICRGGSGVCPAGRRLPSWNK